mmetsp:Transcript_92810/g.193999  ORF Transcript_92810/g.193999 Transcript_92810/m.193999 type:complete len:246 (-) Transcript_92810:112-849(-)
MSMSQPAVFQLVAADGVFMLKGSYEPGSVATNLGCFLHIFSDTSFVEEVRNFVEGHLPDFEAAAETMSDGSQPLLWTELHHSFRAMFERRLRTVLEAEQLDADDLLSYIEELEQVARQLREQQCQHQHQSEPEGEDAVARALSEPRESEGHLFSSSSSPSPILPGSGGLRVESFEALLGYLTVFEDYDAFLEVMQAASLARRRSDDPTDKLVARPHEEVNHAVGTSSVAAGLATFEFSPAQRVAG